MFSHALSLPCHRIQRRHIQTRIFMSFIFFCFSSHEAAGALANDLLDKLAKLNHDAENDDAKLNSYILKKESLHIDLAESENGNEYLNRPADGDELEKMWSQCNCPANDPNYNHDDNQSGIPSARMAYLISVHNKRTIHDGAYLLKALMETSHPGNTAIILIHVDKRVGVASREDNSSQDGDYKNNFSYDDSPLNKYVDACLATPLCTRNSESNSNDNATILEVSSHFSPEWSKWSMNDPTLWAMDYLSHHPLLQRAQSANVSLPKSPWDVFINLSGDSIPVISAQRIAQLFEPTNGPLGNTNFVTSSSCVTGLLPTSIYDFPNGWMKRVHYFQRHIPKKLSYVDLITGEYLKDDEIDIYFGSQWMALTREFVEFVIRSMDHPNGLGKVLKDAMVNTGVSMTDETFFATLLMNSPSFEHTIPVLNDEGALARFPSMYALRYERMDENAPNAWGEFRSVEPLYDVPPKFGEKTDGEAAAKPWGPYFLGVYDLGNIRRSGAIFIRKVSWAVDENLLKMLPVVKKSGAPGNLDMTAWEWDELPNIDWPSLGVKIKDPFVWRYRDERAEGKGLKK
ncbi:hypothetical protein ACHAXS_011497 [Conticribra weissflogii]